MVAPQVDFIRLDNFIPNRQLHNLRKRGGSYEWDHEGGVWGIGGYVRRGASPKMPTFTIPIRHRRVGGTSFIEKLDWSDLGWDAITQGASTTFDIGDVASFAQIGDLLCIAADRPAKLTDIASGSLSRLGGPYPVTPPTVAAGSAGSLSDTPRYLYTFYDSTSGWESSPSPPSEPVTLNSEEADLSDMETTCAREGVDKKRIYRTITTGEEPFMLLATIDLGDATYTDDASNDDLGQVAPDDGDHDPPPEDVYIVAAHAGRLWLASGNALWWSKVFNGENVNLEYFSLDRREFFPHQITGLAPTRSGGLYVFQPPGQGIWEKVGDSDATFQNVLLYPNEGTNFHASVTSHEDLIAYWGPRGPQIAGPGGLIAGVDQHVRELYRDTLTEEFNSDAFVWSVWHHGTQSFIFGASFTQTDAGLWRAADSQIVVGWSDVATGAAGTWTEV